MTRSARATAAVTALLVPLLALPGSLVSARRPAPGQEQVPLELIHAGRVSGRTERGPGGTTRITDLADSVLFRHGDQWVLADRASYSDRQEEVRLSGRVRGWDDTWRVSSDEAVYRAPTRVLVATGNVHAHNIEDGTVVEADELTFDRTRDEGVAVGSPFLFQPAADSTAFDTKVRGSERSRLLFRGDAAWAELSGGALVERGEMLIRGRWLRSEQDARVLTVRDSVRLQKEGIDGGGGFLRWDEEAGLARLLGPDPWLVRRSAREEGSADSVWTRMSADSLDIEVEGDVLTAILLHGPGEVLTRTIPGPETMMTGPDSTLVPAQPEHMHLRGREITITLEDELLNDLTARRAAIYYWRADLPERQNAMGGLELHVLFTGGEPSQITSTGNAVTRFFESMDPEGSDMVRAMATVITLTVEDGEFRTAHADNGDLHWFSRDEVLAGNVPLAVHPDSVEVSAGRPQRRPPPPE